MRMDDAYYAEVEKLADVIHEQKGNPLTGAFDSWKEAERMVLARRSRQQQIAADSTVLRDSLISA